MIDIVFDDSVCGSLKIAQHYGEGEYKSGCMNMIVSHTDGSAPTTQEIAEAQQQAEERERLVWERATPLGGNRADVFGFSLALSVGELSVVTDPTEGMPIYYRILRKAYL